MIEAGDNVLERLAAIFGRVVRRPGDSYRMMAKPGWARRTTILLAMQTEGPYMKMHLSRHALTLFRKGFGFRYGPRAGDGPGPNRSRPHLAEQRRHGALLNPDADGAPRPFPSVAADPRPRVGEPVIRQPGE